MKNLLFVGLIFLAACTKKSGNNSGVFENENGISTSLNYFEEGRKRYSEKICYLVSDPNNFGTECTDPGESCKKYECTLSASRGNNILSEGEIETYASADVDYLVRKGFIDESSVVKFKNLYRSEMVKKNYRLAKGKMMK